MAAGLALDTETLLEAARVVAGLTGRVGDLAVAAALHRVAEAVPAGRSAA